MSATISVPAGDRDTLWLFQLDMPREQARFLAEPGAVAQMLGIDTKGPIPDPAQIEIINTKDLAGVGLVHYLTDGFSIPADQIDKPAIEALTGYVLILRARAFGGEALTLTPAAQLKLVARYQETPTDWTAAPMLHTGATKAPTPPRAARSQARRLGATLFAIIMALVALIVLAVAT